MEGNGLRQHARQHSCAEYWLFDTPGTYLRTYGLRLRTIQVQGKEHTLLYRNTYDPCAFTDHSYSAVYVLPLLQSIRNLSCDHRKLHQLHQKLLDF